MLRACRKFICALAYRREACAPSIFESWEAPSSSELKS